MSPKTRVHLMGVIGRGSFGEVYLGQLTTPGGLQQRVAVKVLRSDVTPASQALLRLSDEARLLSLLRHDAIPTVFDVVDVDGHTALVTEVVEGQDLADCVVGPSALSPRALVQVIERVADALDAAQGTLGPDGQPLGLVHRDLKPTNIRLTTRGEVKVLDFGLAKANMEGLQAATLAGTLLGTVSYLAPERLRAVDSSDLVASDMFSLGCLLFEGLTGQRLFQRMDVHQRIALSTSREDHEAYVRDRIGRVPELPAEVVALMKWMLAYKLDDRPSMADVAHRCEEIAPALEGASLRRWAMEREWPPLVAEPGAWVGHQVQLGETAAETFELSVEPERDPVGARFVKREVLFEGAGGRTLRATDQASGRNVILQEYPLPKGAKAEAQVRRRVEMRAQLSHDRIPAISETIEAGRGASRSIWLVLRDAEGPSLSDELAERRFSEQEVLAVMDEVLEILVYLHERQPPVYLRDLAPTTFRRGAGGRLLAVELGVVGGLPEDEDIGGSSVVGTLGYMAPEQYGGDADARSDLYGLGALAIGMLTREAPHTMQAPGQPIRFERKVSLSPEMVALLKDLTAILPSARPSSAREVQARLTELTRPSLPTQAAAQALVRPELPLVLAKLPSLERAAMVRGVATHVGVTSGFYALTLAGLFAVMEPVFWSMLYLAPLFVGAAALTGLFLGELKVDLHTDDAQAVHDQLSEALNHLGFTIWGHDGTVFTYSHTQYGRLKIRLLDGRVQVAGPRPQVKRLLAHLTLPSQ